MKERRRNPRQPYADSIMIRLYKVADHQELAGEAIVGTSEDVSADGVRFRCSKELEIGTTLELSVVTTHAWGLFSMSATVRWTQPSPDGDGYTVGIKFDPSERDMERWGRFVKDLQAEG